MEDADVDAEAALEDELSGGSSDDGGAVKKGKKDKKLRKKREVRWRDSADGESCTDWRDSAPGPEPAAWGAVGVLHGQSSVTSAPCQ